MEIHTYRDKTLKGALARIRAELGPHAVIHATRYSRKPWPFSLFLRETVEIDASRAGAGPCLPYPCHHLGQADRVERAPAHGGESAVEQTLVLAKTAPVKTGDWGRRFLSVHNKASSSRLAPPGEAVSTYAAIRPDGERGLGRSLVERRYKAAFTGAGTVPGQNANRAGCASAHHEELRAALLRQGFPEADARRLSEAAASSVGLAPPGEIGDASYSHRLKTRLIALLRTMLRTSPGIEPGDHGPRFFAFVGPTGSGKTTTVAKLAAHAAVYSRVGIVTIDNYRVGGVEQARRYAEMLGVPFFHVSSEREASAARSAMKNCDIVLVDTTGRSPSDKMAVSEMARLLEKIGPDEVILTVEAGILGESAERIRMSFGRYFRVGRVIVTKVDELPFVGAGVALSMGLSAPIAYVTNGQQVPDDIRRAGRESILQLIAGTMGM